MSFKALLVEKDDEGKTSASVQTLEDSQLPEGDVTVAVEYSTVNYKDGLCVGPGGGLGLGRAHAGQAPGHLPVLRAQCHRRLRPRQAVPPVLACRRR